MRADDAEQAGFEARLGAAQETVRAALEALLAEGRRPPRLVAAMRHAVLNGGKRMRPFLVLESARLFGVTGTAPVAVAAALELVHCYSLVHDDLPAMDDDDLRRGQPTVHRAFDEATAILAGDALLTLGFAALAAAPVSPGRRARLVAALARGAGLDGMVGGQMLDLAAEGRFEPPRRRRTGAAAIRRIQALKTGALIAFAVEAGAILAPRAGGVERRALRIYGQALGLAFQIRDDLLDVEGDAASVGKALAKDAAVGKATFVGLLGIEGARAELDRVTERGRAALAAAFGDRAATLVALLEFNRARDR
ncbi:MAG: polyprenyl synthetase family protein [Rhabdaerophilum calidifontis]